MAKKCFFAGIISVMLLFVVFEASAVTIDATFVSTENSGDTIVLRKDGTCSVTVDGETVAGTYQLDTYITQGSSTHITLNLNDGSSGRFFFGWGTEQDTPIMLIGDVRFNMRGVSLR